MGTHDRRIRRLGGAGLVALSVAAIPAGDALATVASGPSVPSSYGTGQRAQPSVEINVLKSNTITAIVSCGSTYWNSPKLRLHGGAARFERRTSIYRTDQKTGRTHAVKERVTFTARFTAAGTFTGKARLGGTSCHRTRFTAKSSGSTGTGH